MRRLFVCERKQVHGGRYFTAYVGYRTEFCALSDYIQFHLPSSGEITRQGLCMTFFQNPLAHQSTRDSKRIVTSHTCSAAA